MRQHVERILVTGGDGFIGSRLTRYLYNQVHFVRVADVKFDDYIEEPYFTKKCSDLPPIVVPLIELELSKLCIIRNNKKGSFLEAGQCLFKNPRHRRAFLERTHGCQNFK